jgi:hypothetical protein
MVQSYRLGRPGQHRRPVRRHDGPPHPALRDCAGAHPCSWSPRLAEPSRPATASDFRAVRIAAGNRNARQVAIGGCNGPSKSNGRTTSHPARTPRREAPVVASPTPPSAARTRVLTLGSVTYWPAATNASRPERCRLATALIVRAIVLPKTAHGASASRRRTARRPQRETGPCLPGRPTKFLAGNQTFGWREGEASSGRTTPHPHQCELKWTARALLGRRSRAGATGAMPEGFSAPPSQTIWAKSSPTVALRPSTRLAAMTSRLQRMLGRGVLSPLLPAPSVEKVFKFRNPELEPRHAH